MPLIGLLVAAAVLFAPWQSVRTHEAEPSREPAGRPRAVALAVAVGALGLGCVLVLGTGPGLAVASLLCPCTWVGVRWLASRPRDDPPGREVALALDLCAAALRAGRTPADALRAAAPAAGRAVAEALLAVAGLLRLGAGPAEAWRSVAESGPLGGVRTVAVRSASSGIRSAAAFERLAEEIRDDAAARATARAHRAGVSAMGPLAACFLPSFVCLGIVPVIVGVARSVLGVIP